MKIQINFYLLLITPFLLFLQSCGKGVSELEFLARFPIISNATTETAPHPGQPQMPITTNGTIELFAQNVVAPINIIGPASATFNWPTGIAVDSFGNIYIADTGNNVIRKITPIGEVSTIAGTGAVGSLDAVSGNNATFNSPCCLAINSSGDIYVSDTNNNIIRKIDSLTGAVTTVAGSGAAGYVDNPLGLLATFNRPQGIFVDSSNNIYVADSNNDAIRIITTSTGAVTSLVSGFGFFFPVGPNSVVVDSAQNAYALCSGSWLFKIDPLGNRSPVLNYTYTDSSYIYSPSYLTIDSADNLYIADNGTKNIYKIDTSLYPGLNDFPVTNVAGGGSSLWNDGIGTSAGFNNPMGITIDSSGNNLFVTDASNENVRKIVLQTLTVSTLAGTFDPTTTNFSPGPNATGSSNTIAPASLFLKQGRITRDSQGNIYIVDTFTHRILKFTTDGAQSVFAGSGTEGHTDAVGVLASFRYPQGITIDTSNNLYVADTFNHTIRQITPTGIVSTFAGIATLNGFRDGYGTSLSSAAQFDYPHDITIDSSGNLYVLDSVSSLIRKITPAGVVTTIPGISSSTQGYVDGVIAQAQLGYLQNISVDSSGNIYAVDMGNNVIRKITTLLGLAVDVGTLTGFLARDNSLSPNLIVPTGGAIGADAYGNIYWTDSNNNVLQKRDKNGIITTIAGTTGTAAFATGALPGTLLTPSSFYVDPLGTFLYVLENNSIIKITFSSN